MESAGSCSYLQNLLESNKCEAFDYDEYFNELPTKKKLQEIHCSSNQLHAVEIRDAILNQVTPESIHVQYLCKMSNGHLNVHWTFLFVHWTNGHLNVHWTFLFCPMDEWTFECRMDISVRPLVEWTYECPMDISVRPMVEWTFVYVQWTLLIFNTKYDNAGNAFCLLKAIMN